jgi:serine/threonine protein kinase
MFSLGVILFIIVQGIFPFKEARREEYFYSLLLSGQIDTYFSKVNGTGLSAGFKNLILSLFAYDPEKRMTLEQLKANPWMNDPSFDYEATRNAILSQLSMKQAQAQPQPPQQKPVKVKRSKVMM